MKKLTLPLVVLISMVFCFSCKDDDQNCVNHPGDFRAMNLEDLEVGQSFRFVLFEGESYYDEDNYDFDYKHDTLVVTVVSENNGMYTLSEAITPFSEMMTATENYYWGEKNEVIENVWDIKNDTLWLAAAANSRYINSHLFFGHDTSFGFPLKDFSGKKVSIRGWKTDPPYQWNDPDLYTVDYNLFDLLYDRLNILVFNQPMIRDGNGETYIYSRKHGIVKTSTYSAWTGMGQGWDRLD